MHSSRGAIYEATEANVILPFPPSRHLPPSQNLKYQTGCEGAVVKSTVSLFPAPAMDIVQTVLSISNGDYKVTTIMMLSFLL
jgi:hypothetical protein